MIAALFTRADSVYKGMPGVDAYDEARDARTWPGGCAVVAHPPGRGWARLRHFSHATPEELQLAVDAVAHVRRWGGVLDSFAGAGTTGLVASAMQRDSILVELNPGYGSTARDRIDGPLFAQASS